MIIVGFGQQLCTFNMNMKVDFPRDFVELSGALSFLNFDIVNIMSSLCMIEGSYYSMLQLQFWFPTLLCIILMFDFREHCYDAKWSSYAAIAIPGIIVYVIGTP